MKELLDEILIEILIEKEQNEYIKLLSRDENIDFIKDLKFDSIDIITLIVKVEDKFEINILDKENFIEIVYDYNK